MMSDPPFMHVWSPRLVLTLFFSCSPLLLQGQVTIPYSMIISWLYLGSRYRVDHFLGATMVSETPFSLPSPFRGH